MDPEVQCHIQRLSNNPYFEPKESNSLQWHLFLFFSSYLCLGLPRCIFPVGLFVKILKELLPSFILARYLSILIF